MILKQYFLGCLAHASYLIGDAESGAAAVVDPQRDVEQYVHDAEERGLSIRHVLLTHFHADFVSGHLELRERTGADVCLGARARAEFPFRALREGEVLDLGPQARVEVLETPGHTPESVCFLVYDLEQGARAPAAVLTGDTLFLGDVGRPDLLASVGVSQEELAGLLHASIAKLMELPDETLVYPAHGAGSFCGKDMSEETVSTVGEQRRRNYAFRPLSREEFVRLVTAGQPAAPRYFAHDASLNRKERPTLEDSLASLRPLALEEVLRRQDAGAQLLDVRDAAAFARGHLPGSLNVGLDGKFATWAGALLDPALPVVIVADPGRVGEAATRLGRVGFDAVAGFLGGGAEAWGDRPDLVVKSERLDATELAQELAAPDPPAVLDVRSAAEWERGHVPGAIHLPLPELPDRLAELPREGRLVVHCQSGYRSAAAASLLERAGIRAADLVGGFSAWEAAGPRSSPDPSPKPMRKPEPRA